MIMVSPTGARLDKKDHPNLPITIPEIVEAVHQSALAGAEAVHLHVRDANGQHVLDAGLYEEASCEIALQNQHVAVQITTEAAGIYAPSEQLELLEKLMPTAASISLREVRQDRDVARRIYDMCRSNEVEVQHIVYDDDDARLLQFWQDEGVLDENASVILVLGSYVEGRPASIPEFTALKAALPSVGQVMACAFGPTEHTCLSYAAAQGADVRVGFENSICDENGRLWDSVATSVKALKTRLEAAR